MRFQSAVLGAFLFIVFSGISVLHAAPEVPKLTGRVVDQAKIFSPAGVKRIEAMLETFENATDGQLFILTIPTLDGTPIEEFSLKVAEQWKPGKNGNDKGAVLLIVFNDRKTRLEIGYDWEGEINDARAGDVLRSMAPFFQQNRYDDGVLAAVADIQKILTGTRPDDAPPQSTGRNREKSGDLPKFIILAVFIILILSLPWGRGGTGGFRGFGGFGGGGGFHGGGGFRGGGGGGGFGGGGASGKW